MRIYCDDETDVEVAIREVSKFGWYGIEGNGLPSGRVVEEEALADVCSNGFRKKAAGPCFRSRLRDASFLDRRSGGGHLCRPKLWLLKNEQGQKAGVSQRSSFTRKPAASSSCHKVRVPFYFYLIPCVS